MFLAALTVDRFNTLRVSQHSSSSKPKASFACELLFAVATSSFLNRQFVASPGVEPGLWVPETRVISIILRGYVWGLKIRCIFVEN